MNAYSIIFFGIYGQDEEYSDCLRLSFSQIQKNTIPEAIYRFSESIHNTF